MDENWCKPQSSDLGRGGEEEDRVAEEFNTLLLLLRSLSSPALQEFVKYGSSWSAGQLGGVLFTEHPHD